VNTIKHLKKFHNAVLSFEEMEQVRREIWEKWAKIDKRLWLREILYSSDEMIQAAQAIYIMLKSEIFRAILILVLRYEKIKTKIKNFKEIYIMKKFYTLTVGEDNYNLRLTANAIMQIEKKLDKSLFAALETVQENMIETVVAIIWGAAQAMNHGFSYEKALQLFDDYIDEGHSIEEFMLEVNALFEASGFFKKGQEQGRE
jgi:hypothetical protein